MLETKIEALTQAVIALTELIGKIEDSKTMASAPVIVKAEKPAPAPVVTAPAPVVNCAPAAPVMPAAPTFEPVQDGTLIDEGTKKAPFTDGKGLIEYVMSAYKEMGAEKGAKIQGVLTELGLQNVNELRPTEYDAFYTKVEALK